MTLNTFTSRAALAVLIAAGASSTAFAGGLSEPVIAPTPAPVAVAAPVVSYGSDWSGFYAGGSLGYGQIEGEGLGDEFEGATLGAHVGYNYDLGSIVLGAELEGNFANDFTDDASGLELDNVLRAKVRAGYDAGAFLPYATAGYAQATVNTGGVEIDDDGYFYGFGVDYAVSDAVTVGGEVLRHEFEDFNGGADLEVDTFALRVSYNF